MDTEQVMRVENLMRSARMATILNYKPDIFYALGIFRNNKWGFRPTIYSSKVMMMQGGIGWRQLGLANGITTPARVSCILHPPVWGRKRQAFRGQE